MRGDDLVPLFADDAAGARIRQGVIVSWDVGSGVGSVNVAGRVIPSVPFLTAGGITWLAPGDPVLLIAQGAAWFILGRAITPTPGGTRGYGRNTQGTLFGNTGTISGWGLTTSYATKATLNIPVPGWALTASIAASLQILVKNPTAVSDFFTGQIAMPDGATMAQTSGNVPAGTWQQLTTTFHWGVYVVPGGTLTILGNIRSQAAAWAAEAGNVAIVQASALFNSNGGV